MRIFVFGNEDLDFDSLPIRILPELKKRFPEISFEIKDPNEDWDIPEELVILDTVVGLDGVRVFSDLKHFAGSPRLTLHDFDLGSQLAYLNKLGKLRKIKIIGIPPTISETTALQETESILRSSQP